MALDQNLLLGVAAALGGGLLIGIERERRKGFGAQRSLAGVRTFTLAALLGAGFTLQGLGWLVAPDRAAIGLGMPVLDGLGRSTQFGDFAAFFLTGGLTMLAGTRPGRGRLLYVPAGLFGLAAVGRTVAWAVHGAAFAPLFIGVEVATSVLLLALAGGDEQLP